MHLTLNVLYTKNHHARGDFLFLNQQHYAIVCFDKRLVIIDTLCFQKVVMVLLQ